MIKRGIMNRLKYTVQNKSSQPLNGIMLKSGVGGHTHKSQTFSLEAGESKVIPVIVGGYKELTDMETLTTTIQITPNPGETTRIIRIHDIEVKNSPMVLEIKNEEFIRGGAGKVWFTLENSGAADVEIITAEQSSKQASTQIT